MVGFDVIFDLMLSIDGSGGAVSAPSWVVYFALLRDADSLAVSAHLPVSVASNNLCCTRRSRKGSGVRRGGGKSIKEISAADPAAASERRQTGLPPFYLIDTTLLWLITTLRDKKRKSFGSFVFFFYSFVCLLWGRDLWNQTPAPSTARWVNITFEFSLIVVILIYLWKADKFFPFRSHWQSALSFCLEFATSVVCLHSSVENRFGAVWTFCLNLKSSNTQTYWPTPPQTQRKTRAYTGYTWCQVCKK